MISSINLIPKLVNTASLEFWFTNKNANQETTEASNLEFVQPICKTKIPHTHTHIRSPSYRVTVLLFPAAFSLVSPHYSSATFHFSARPLHPMLPFSLPIKSVVEWKVMKIWQKLKTHARKSRTWAGYKMVRPAGRLVCAPAVIQTLRAVLPWCDLMPVLTNNHFSLSFSLCLVFLSNNGLVATALHCATAFGSWLTRHAFSPCMMFCFFFFHLEKKIMLHVCTTTDQVSTITANQPTKPSGQTQPQTKRNPGGEMGGK